MRILLLIVCLSFSGCGLVEKALMNTFAPNPEIVKHKTDKEKLQSTQANIVQADTDKKVDALKDTYIASSKEAHPSFFSAVVSGLYTEEGRKMAGMAILALGSTIGLIFKVVQTWGLPGMVANLIRGTQDVKEQYPKGSPERTKINDILKWRQEKAGIWAKVDKKVKKILGES